MLIFPASLPSACRDCALPGFGGPVENRYTAYDAICHGTACRDAGFPQVSVNLADLTLFVRVNDLAFGGPAPALNLEQSFNMDDTGSGLLGAGWAFSLGDRITPDSDGSLVLRRGNGRVDRFATAPGASGYFALTGTRDSLTRAADGTYALRSAASNTTWNFRADGKLASIQEGPATRVALAYDASGRLTGAKYRGRDITFTTDSQERLTKIEDAAGRSVSFTYSGDKLSGQTNADGTTIAYEYDSDGNLTTVTYKGGKYAIAYAGDAGYRSVASVTAPDGATRTYDVPRNASEIQVTDANGDASLYVTSAQGLVQSVRDPSGNTTAYTYDAAGNRTSITNPAGETATFTYDGNGNLTAITDAVNNRWTADYSGGLLTRITDPRRNAWTLRYDDAGNLIGSTDPMTGATSAARNAAGQIASVADAAGNKSTYEYDGNGLLTAATNAAGEKRSFSYDGAARVSGRTDPGGTTLRADYNANNRIVSAGSDDASVNFDFSVIQRDATGRITGYTDSFSNALAYKYDGAGQLTSLTLPGGKTVNYQYDHLRRLSAVSDWAGNMALYRYDTAGYPVSLSIAGGPVAIRQYDAARNVRAVVSAGPDGTPVAGYKYTVDAAGNRTSVVALEPNTSAPALPAYTLTYDAANRPAGRSDGQSYRYDGRGNLSAISGSRNVSFGYDAFGRLTNLGADLSTTYSYDSTGLRATRGDRRYTWDPSGNRPRLVMESDSQGNPIAWYVYGIGLLWKVMADGTTYFYHFDGDGNVVAVSGNGGVVNQYRYDAAGLLIATNEGVENSFRARGESGWIDDGNGLLFTGNEFRFPELRLTLPATVDPAAPLPDARPPLRGPGACFLEGLSVCSFAAGRER